MAICHIQLIGTGLARPSQPMETDMTSIVREFNHRTYGAIGRVVLEADVKVLKVNGKPVPDSSVEYLLTFALQSLQDAYAGAKNEAEAKGAFEGKLAKLMEGSIGVRTGGSGVSEETRVARQIVATMLRTKYASTWEEVKDLDDDAKNERLDAIFAKNEEKLRPAVDARLEELRKERERKAKLAKNVGDLEL